MLWQLHTELRTSDAIFHESESTGLSKQTRRALRDFWKAPPLRKLAGDIGAPHETWAEIYEGWQLLIDGSVPPDALLHEALDDAERLSDRDAFAAAIASLYIVAAWEGSVAPGTLYDTLAVLNRGWLSIPAAVARLLLGVDAIWGARHLATEAIGEITRSTIGEHARYDPEYVGNYEPEFGTALAHHRRILAEVERRYVDSMRTLSWELHTACRDPGSWVRPELASLFWTLGDVPHAHLMRRSDYTPPRDLLLPLIRESLSKLPTDPLVQYVWLRFKDREPIALRSNKRLFTRISIHYSGSLLHQLDAVHGEGGLSPSENYAQALQGYFSGRLSTDDFERFDASLELAATYGFLGPEFEVRLLGAWKLIQSQQDAFIAGWWEDLAMKAAAAVEQRRRFGVYDAYDRSLDIPFFYIPSSYGDDVQFLERLRFAGLWYPLTVLRPLSTPPATGSKRVLSRFKKLLDREEVILDEIRGMRFLAMRDQLPRHYTRIWGYDQNPDPELYSKSRAAQHRTELSQQLTELWDKMASYNAEYANGRRRREVTADDFARALGP